MKITNSLSTVLWVSIVSMLPGDVSAAWGWGSSSSTAANEVKEVKVNDDDAATAVVLPTVVNSRTLQSIIDTEKRFVLYNSRRLTGECLPICAEDNDPTPKPSSTRTESPTLRTTFPPISEGQEGTLPPSSIGTDFPTFSPSSIGFHDTQVNTDFPTFSPSSIGDPQVNTDFPTFSPSSPNTDPPTGFPTAMETKVSTGFPTTMETNFPTAMATEVVSTKPVDPSTFCRMENSVAWNSDSNCSGKPGSCQMRNPYNGDNSCGPGVPPGFYPDLTRCDAYCKCTGKQAPSEYMIVDQKLEWDTHQQGTNYYLKGVWGNQKDGGAWGTNGGGQCWPHEMTIPGRDRPPHCGSGPVCPDKKWHGCDNCQQFYNCATGVASALQKCTGGLLWDESINACNWDTAFTCTDNNGNLPCEPVKE